MLVSLPLRAMFIHNPRCAGSAITTALVSDEGTDNRCDEWKFQRPWIIDKKIPVDQHGIIVPPRFLDFYTFCVVRNPYTRFLSEWCFRKQYEGHRMTFEEYVRHVRPARHYFGFQIKYAKICNAIFRFEDIIRQGYIDLPFGRVTLKQLNGTQHGHTSKYFRGEMEPLFYKKYRRDFDAFGYQRHDFGDE